MTKKPKKVVVYRITNKINNKFYIGSSKDWESRKWNHKSELRRNIHSNPYLQRAWNKYGEENFDFSAIEFNVPANKLKEREQWWIDTTNCLNPSIGYNIAKQATHPNPRTFTIQDRKEEGLRKSDGGYLVIFPDSTDEYFVESLALFVESWPEYNLEHSCLTACARGEISNHRGFKVKFANSAKQKDYVSKYDQREEAFVLFDLEGNRYITNNLTKFCREHKLESNREALVLCAQGKNYHSAGWQCHYIDIAPEEYIPTDKLANRIKYLIFDPEGNQYSTQNLTKFCEEYNLKENSMRRVSLPDYPNKSYKGWTCFRDDETLANRDEVIKYKGKIPVFKYQVNLPDGRQVKGKSIRQLEKELDFNRDMLARIYRGEVVKRDFTVVKL